MPPAAQRTALPIAPPSPREPLRDGQGRAIRYLRLSVTESCNFRCTYCSPAVRSVRSPALDAVATVRLAGVFASLGISRVRLTGGEPLLRRDLPDIARGIAALPGVEEVCLTTNGDRLAPLARTLAEAGVSRVNISLDTLDPARFSSMTRGGELQRVREGIDAARQAGFARVRLNIVVVEGVNDSAAELASLARFAWERSLVPRFIELMPFGEGVPVPVAQVIERLGSQGIEVREARVPDGRPRGPAVYHAAADRQGPGGDIGFIGSMTQRFCERCNRVRVTAAGELRSCLGGRDGVSLAARMRDGATDSELAAAVREALGIRPDGHSFQDPDAAGMLPRMVSTGG